MSNFTSTPKEQAYCDLGQLTCCLELSFLIVKLENNVGSTLSQGLAERQSMWKRFEKITKALFDSIAILLFQALKCSHFTVFHPWWKLLIKQIRNHCVILGIYYVWGVGLDAMANIKNESTQLDE